MGIMKERSAGWSIITVSPVPAIHSTSSTRTLGIITDAPLAEIRKPLWCVTNENECALGENIRDLTSKWVSRELIVHHSIILEKFRPDNTGTEGNKLLLFQIRVSLRLYFSLSLSLRTRNNRIFGNRTRICKRKINKKRKEKKKRKRKKKKRNKRKKEKYKKYLKK